MVTPQRRAAATRTRRGRRTSRPLAFNHANVPPKTAGETECGRDGDSRSNPARTQGVPEADQPGEGKQDQPRDPDPPDPRRPVILPQLHGRTLESQAAGFPQETGRLRAICGSSAYSLSGHLGPRGVTAETCG
jgi:hypothetical protein